MHAEHVKERFNKAIHRTDHKLSERELEEVTVVMLAVVTELAAEMAEVVAELAQRVEKLEGAAPAAP